MNISLKLTKFFLKSTKEYNICYFSFYYHMFQLFYIINEIFYIYHEYFPKINEIFPKNLQKNTIYVILVFFIVCFNYFILFMKFLYLSFIDYFILLIKFFLKSTK